MGEKESLKQLYERMYRAMIEKDEAVLREVLADDFVLVHMTGLRQNKDTYIRYIMNGTLNYFDKRDREIEVTLNGTAAALTGKSEVSAAVFGGSRGTWRLCLEMRARKENEQWQFTYATASLW